MIKIMRYLEEDYFRYLNLTYSLNSIYACAILLLIVYVLYLTTATYFKQACSPTGSYSQQFWPVTTTSSNNNLHF